MSYIGNQPTSVAFLTDTFSGNGSTTAFTMSVAPATTSSMLVAITGVVQDPSTYSIVGTTLTFSAAPPTGTGNISVRYLGIPASGVTTTAYRTVTEFTATAGQTTFTPPSYTVGYISVYRNGVMLGSADYTASNGTTVVLAAGASVGDLVTTESFYVSSVLNAIPATAGAVNSTYIADNSVVTAKITDANVTQAKLAAGVAGNGPAFSAFFNGSQTINDNSATAVALNTEEFDTNSCFNTSTYRFTPNVAGYYQISGAVYFSTASINYGAAIIGKNGSAYKYGPQNANGAYTYGSTVSAIIYFNGTTDYVELWAYQNSGVARTLQSSASPLYNYMTGAMVRAA